MKFGENELNDNKRFVAFETGYFEEVAGFGGSKSDSNPDQIGFGCLYCYCYFCYFLSQIASDFLALSWAGLTFEKMIVIFGEMSRVSEF